MNVGVCGHQPEKPSVGDPFPADRAGRMCIWTWMEEGNHTPEFQTALR